jgi:predicted RNA binding protein YcfA (HicA-like mRNA interferase family)
MPKRSFSDLTQGDWIHACRRLGLTVDTRGGKGSHVLIEHPATHKKYTIQRHLHKYINIKIFKHLQEWGYTEDQLWEALR